MKKITLYILILVALTGIFSPVSYVKAVACTGPNTPAGCTPASTNTNYTLLAPLSCQDGEDCVNGEIKSFTLDDKALGKYINLIITLVIGISAVLAVVMIVMGGIQYMGSELISEKQEGKDRIWNAILGLLIALGAYALLNTINPNLLNSDVNIPVAEVTVNLGGESTSIPFKPIEKGSLAGLGINCPGTGGKGSTANIGQQFIGKSTYSQERRNTISTSTVYLDCSSFAAQVYACAGVGNPGGTTEAMFTKPTAQRINGATFNYASLAPGTLIGWRPSDDKYGNGHVMIYMGGGKVLHATSTSNVTISNLSEYQARVTYVVS